VNNILKQRWFDMPDKDRDIWKQWQGWDRLRYKRDLAIYNKAQNGDADEDDLDEDTSAGNVTATPIPQKRKGTDPTSENDANTSSSFHIPKKKRS